MTDQAVIHKLLLSISRRPQEFDVPRNAELVHIDRDTRAEDAIAVWYRRPLTHPGYTGPEYTRRWRFSVVGTGAPGHPTSATYLGTVVWPGFAWHVLDLDGTVRGDR